MTPFLIVIAPLSELVWVIVRSRLFKGVDQRFQFVVAVGAKPQVAFEQRFYIAHIFPGYEAIDVLIETIIDLFAGKLIVMSHRQQAHQSLDGLVVQRNGRTGIGNARGAPHDPT